MDPLSETHPAVENPIRVTMTTLLIKGVVRRSGRKNICIPQLYDVSNSRNARSDVEADDTAEDCGNMERSPGRQKCTSRTTAMRKDQEVCIVEMTAWVV